ncbi:MAG: 4-hydroxythreonine-4-phosphate dehydrogenase PdxA, partial [Bacteroidota bacterium]
MSEHEHRPKIGITIGDYNGVGPEIIIKAFTDVHILQICTPVIYGSSKVISFYRKTLNNAEFNYNTIRSSREIIHKKVNVINCWEEEVNIVPGEASTVAGQYAFRALEQATGDLQQGLIEAMVTGPIDKYSIQNENFKFAGHTEYLAEKFGQKKYAMILASGNFRVATVTGHIPVGEVSASLSIEKILEKISVVNDSLKRDFGVRKPRIAVLGLNPHAGDHGLLGKEEETMITPAIKQANEQKIVVFGPYSADGFFASSNYKNFDAVIAMYHDQGL